MIEDPPLLTIRRHFCRPTSNQILRFDGIETGFIVDAMNGRGALDGRIKPLFKEHASFFGTALTCHAGPADNLAIFGALEIAKRGDIIVATTDQFHETAIIGDLVLGMMKNKGISAFVTDGFVRDIKGLKEVEIPCFCMGVTPNSPSRNGPGTIGQTISIGNVTVNSGDLIAGDQDGVVIVPFSYIDKTITKLDDVKAKEAALSKEVKDGLVTPDFIRSIFQSDKVKEIK